MFKAYYDWAKKSRSEAHHLLSRYGYDRARATGPGPGPIWAPCPVDDESQYGMKEIQEEYGRRIRIYRGDNLPQDKTYTPLCWTDRLGANWNGRELLRVGIYQGNYDKTWLLVSAKRIGWVWIETDESFLSVGICVL